MDGSPQMYDSGGQVGGGPGGQDMKKGPPAANNNQPGAVNHNAPPPRRHLPQYSHPELDELTGQEISLDLQHLIEDQFRDQEGLALLQEILPGGRGNPAAAFPRTTLAYMPQGVHQGGPPPFAAPFPAGPSYVTNGAGGSFLPVPAAPPHLLKHKAALQHPHHAHHGSASARRHAGKALDKGTDEYRRRRERNNIAVRKSREKAKVRSREVEEKVKCLIREKDSLIKRLEAVSSELGVHKQMYVHLMNMNLPEITDLCRGMLNLGAPDHPM